MKFLTGDEIYKIIEQIINEAEKSLKIASAWIKGRYFEAILEKAKGKNLDVEVILRASEFQDLMITDDRTFKKIKEAGGKIYLSDRLHAKFLIADDRIAVVGSANFTESGLSEFSRGNIEAGVVYDTTDRREEIERLLEYFEKIKSESVQFGDNLIGFAMNPVKSDAFEFVLIDEDIGEQSYVEVILRDSKGEENKLLARINSIYAYDIGFFANPFTSQESLVFASFEDFKKIFSDDKDREWKKAAVYAYLNGNSNKIRIASAEIVGLIKNGRLDSVRRPFDVGLPIYRASSETLRELMNKKFSGENMKYPTRVGKLEDSDIDVFIDGDEVVSKHMLVIGTTGSGKSYFTKTFICALLKSFDDLQIFVFDPHGEYKETPCVKENAEHVIFKDTLFPISAEEVKELIESAGYGNLIKGNSGRAKQNLSEIQKVAKPSLYTTGFSKESLGSLLGRIHPDLQRDLSLTFGSKALSNQPEICQQIQKALDPKKRIVIFNLKDIIDPQTRVNIAGLIMQDLFNEAKKEAKNRLIVLEEAHNFAPEKGYGDVSSGRNNLALTMAKKIASEGRKFKLGLLTITQRPAQVSKYVLSQMNTQAMFRTMNSHDLEAVSTYVEYAGESIVNILPSLPTGTGILSGAGVPFPVVVEIK